MNITALRCSFPFISTVFGSRRTFNRLATCLLTGLCIQAFDRTWVASFVLLLRTRLIRDLLSGTLIARVGGTLWTLTFSFIVCCLFTIIVFFSGSFVLWRLTLPRSTTSWRSLRFQLTSTLQIRIWLTTMDNSLPHPSSKFCVTDFDDLRSVDSNHLFCYQIRYQSGLKPEQTHEPLQSCNPRHGIHRRYWMRLPTRLD